MNKILALALEVESSLAPHRSGREHVSGRNDGRSQEISQHYTQHETEKEENPVIFPINAEKAFN